MNPSVVVAAFVSASLGLTAPPPAAGAKASPPERLLQEQARAAEELTRAVEGLNVEGAPPVYRAALRLVRAELLSIDGSYGGVPTEVRQRQAAALIDLRVGDADRDSGGFLSSESGQVRFDAPLDPAPKSLAHRMWLALDRAFRGARGAYAAKDSVWRRLAISQPYPEYSRRSGGAPTVEAPPKWAPWPEGAWRSEVQALSRTFESHPRIDNGDVHLQLLRTHGYVMHDDGVAVSQGGERGVIAVVAEARAADGMPIDHGRALHFRGVPTADTLAAAEALTKRVLEETEAMVVAPRLEEDYDGPVLFRGEAAAQLLASTVAGAASGTPAPLSESGRVVELEPAWQRRVGKGVLPQWLSLTDDPRAPGFGSYEWDAEGIRAQKVSLVSRGTLSDLLMTRRNNAARRISNGHARMSPALGVGTAISNLELRAHARRLGREAMERELLRRAREDGYEFAYVIEWLRDGTVLGPLVRETAMQYGGGRKIVLPVPALVYRLDAPGRRTLVRGVMLAPVSIRVLRRVRAVGRRAQTVPMRVAVGPSGGFGVDLGIDGVLAHTVDAQVRTPDLLIDGFELLAEHGEQERLPTLTHPLRRPIETRLKPSDVSRFREP